MDGALTCNPNVIGPEPRRNRWSAGSKYESGGETSVAMMLANEFLTAMELYAAQDRYIKIALRDAVECLPLRHDRIQGRKSSQYFLTL